MNSIGRTNARRWLHCTFDDGYIARTRDDGYIALSSSEFNVCITGIWKENYLGIVLLSRSYFQKL